MSLRIGAWVPAVGDAILSVVLAPVCAVCDTPLDRPLDGPVCETCWRSIPPPASRLCRVCGDSLITSTSADPNARCARCVRSPRAISMGRSVGPYDGTLREILQALKYDRRRSLAAPLAVRMAAAGHAVLDGADCVVPVPLHFTRRYQRGFNQAAELASRLPLPMVDALRRARRTITQTELPEEDRHANVRGAFRVRRRAAARIENAVVVIVDDVSTTGATVDACARALLEAGAREVRALTAARAAGRVS